MWWIAVAAAANPALVDWQLDLARPGCHREAAEAVQHAWPALPDTDRAEILGHAPFLASRFPPPPADALSCAPPPSDS